MKGKLIKTDVNYILEDNKGVVIASTSLKKEGLSLSLKNCQSIELGYDLGELAENHWDENNRLFNDGINPYAHRFGFKAGFQKCLELMVNKKFSEEDIREAYSRGQTNSPIQSLQQNEWDVKIEMGYVGECNGNNDNGCFQDSSGHNCGCFKRKPKLDATGCLILKRI